MSVNRVGFFLGQVGWLGGVNYFRNLFEAINSLPDAKIRPVVFVGHKADITAYESLVEVVRTPILDRYSFSWWANKIVSRITFHREYLLYFFLRKHRITVISHYPVLWRGCSIASIGWIPDFQHLHLPVFFEKKRM